MVSLGFSLPCLILTANSEGNFSQPYSLKSIGSALVFLTFSYLLMVWFSNILVNFKTDPYVISIEGFDP